LTIITTVSIEELATIVQEAGYRASIETVNDTIRCISTASDGQDWLIAIQDVGTGCRLGFEMVFLRPSDGALEFCNRYNSKFVHNLHAGETNKNGDCLLFLKHYSDLSAGVSRDWLIAEFERFVAAVSNCISLIIDEGRER